MLLSHGAVIVLVDGKNFELFRNTGNESAPELSPLPAPKLDTHNKNAGARHHVSSANPSGHQLEEDGHAATVTDWLNQQVLTNAIAHLVVIAAPRTLGEMRRRYHDRLKAVLVGELAIEMTGRSSQEVLKTLRGI